MESSFLLHRSRPFTHRNPSTPFLSRPNHPSTASSALKKTRGFGVSKPLKQKQQKQQQQQQKKQKNNYLSEDDNDEDDEEEEEEDTVPEVVTNRMMKRMGLSVGIPLTVGLLFFPFFYYLKVVAKVDVPNWVPFLVSLTLFGAAFLGVSYGIVSASWDPLREGSLLGWKEARRNWPVFWESLRRGGGGGGTSRD